MTQMGGLQNTISSGTNIRRRWRFYDLFDAGTKHHHLQHKTEEEHQTNYISLSMIDKDL